MFGPHGGFGGPHGGFGGPHFGGPHFGGPMMMGPRYGPRPMMMGPYYGGGYGYRRHGPGCCCSIF